MVRAGEQLSNSCPRGQAGSVKELLLKARDQIDKRLQDPLEWVSRKF